MDSDDEKRESCHVNSDHGEWRRSHNMFNFLKASDPGLIQNQAPFIFMAFFAPHFGCLAPLVW